MKSLLLSLFSLVLFGMATPSSAQTASTKVNTYCDASISASDCAMAKEVANRIGSVITLEHDLHTWPPDVYIHDQQDGNGGSMLNAFAHPCGGDIDAGMPYDCSAPEGATKPHVHFTKALMDQVVQGNADRMALIMGHEMGHITLGHTTPYAFQNLGQSEMTIFAFGRQQEIGADLNGTKYALAAGYDMERMMSAFYRFIEMDLSYSSFEGLGASHPSWEERLTFIDEDKINLWRNMMAFRTGVSLLSSEQYTLAAALFREVVTQFPESYEAHANLGYAQLMDYLDQLEPADVANFGIGHIVVGAFTRRPRSMEPAVRGVNAALWFQATTSLQTALRLKPGMAEATANLGIAYLVQPQGKNAPEAKRLLNEAVRLAQYDSGMDSRAKAAIYINAGVAELAEGLLQESFEHLGAAATELNELSGFAPSDVKLYGELTNAYMFNAGLVFAATGMAEYQDTALEHFDVYLSNTSPSSNWWPIAYNIYTAVAKQANKTPRTIESYRANHVPSYRTLTSFVFPNGVQVNLGQPLDEVLNNLGNAGVTTDQMETYNLIENTGLTDYAFTPWETSVWATQEVLSIQLYGLKAPAIGVQETGLGSDIRYLKVGMAESELNRILGTDYERRLLVSWNDDYRFYRDLGLAVAVVKGVVTQLVITQVPYVHAWEPGD